LRFQIFETAATSATAKVKATIIGMLCRSLLILMFCVIFIVYVLLCPVMSPLLVAYLSFIVLRHVLRHFCVMLTRKYSR